MSSNEPTFNYLLTASECNPEQRLNVSGLVAKLITVATLHANALNIGARRLAPEGLTWVLSRVSVEMTRWPKYDEEFTVRTWVENCSRLFSQRNMEFTSTATGEVLGYARTVWVVIDINRRAMSDIPVIDKLTEVISNRPCPIVPMPKLREPSGDEVSRRKYVYRYSDIDFNRHVSTVRYIEQLISQWDLDWCDRYSVARIDLAFLHEAVFAQEVEIVTTVDPSNPLRFTQQISGPVGPCVRAAVVWRDDPYIQKQ
jgi:acyl-ACP thioesterase